MKKAIIAALSLGAMVLAGCAKTEVVETSDSVNIRFDNAYVGNPTKAEVAQVTPTSIDNFYVYATKNKTPNFFNNEKVYRSNGVFVYDNLKQWEAAEYKFAAYSNGGNNGVSGKLEGVSFDGTDLVIAGYTCDATKDLVVATNYNSIDAVNEAVQFTFDHALAMVKFSFVNGMGNNDIVISNFKVEGVNNVADLTVNGETITWGEVTGESVLNNAADFTSTQAAAGESDEFVVIPRKVAQGADDLHISFTATITMAEGDPITKELTATIDDYTWESGLRYNYVATITGTDLDVITFNEPIVNPWNDYTDLENGEISIN